MSVTKIKQLAGPVGANSGAAIVFDDGVPRWSADLRSAILVPNGNNTERPSVPAKGMIRYNTASDRLETFEDERWVNVRSGNIEDLENGPGPLEAGKGIRVNAEGTRLEYYDQAAALARFRFRINYNGIQGAYPASITEVPLGWTVTIVNDASVFITHNLGKGPSMFLSHGKVVSQGIADSMGLELSEMYTIRNSTNSSVFNPSYDLNHIYLNDVTANAMGTDNNTGHAYVDIYFLNT